MAKAFDSIYINFALFGLLVFSLLTFGITLQTQNNPSVTLTNNSLINETYGKLSASLGNMSATAQTQRSLMESEQPTGGIGSLILFSIVSSGRAFTSVITGVFNILVKLPIVFLGLDPLTIGVLSSILLVSIIIGLWVLYKLGG